MTGDMTYIYAMLQDVMLLGGRGREGGEGKGKGQKDKMID